MKLPYCTRSISSVAWLGAPIVLAALLALALPTGCGGSDVTPVANAGGSSGNGGSADTNACTVDDDCTFGEIDKEITKASDCMCLYGCVYLPVTKITAARRLQQHEKFCKPDVDGNGNSCGIDDCVVPGTVACIDGTCQMSSADPSR